MFSIMSEQIWVNYESIGNNSSTNDKLPNKVSLPYVDWWTDTFEVFYEDENWNLSDLLEKNWIEITSNSLKIWGFEVNPEWDNISMNFSSNPDWTIKLVTREKGWKEWGLSIWGSITEYTINNGAITDHKVLMQTRYNPLISTRLTNI